MNLLDFYRQYPDEASCESALRKFREHHGLFCSHCGGLRLSWNPSHKSWTYMDCGHEMQLRSGTVMQSSDLPVREVLPWVHIAISNAKRSILDTYDDIKAEFLQMYLNEFCYKFNLRYFGF